MSVLDPAGLVEIVYDFRGIPIVPGSTVVVADYSGRLHQETVKRIERPGKPVWWVNVRFVGGGYTTPDRIAVLS